MGTASTFAIIAVLTFIVFMLLNYNSNLVSRLNRSNNYNKKYEEEPTMEGYVRLSDDLVNKLIERNNNTYILEINGYDYYFWGYDGFDSMNGNSVYFKCRDLKAFFLLDDILKSKKFIELELAKKYISENKTKEI